MFLLLGDLHLTIVVTICKNGLMVRLQRFNIYRKCKHICWIYDGYWCSRYGKFWTIVYNLLHEAEIQTRITSKVLEVELNILELIHLNIGIKAFKLNERI